MNKNPNQTVSESYQKARKIFAAFSGLVIIWTFVGIDITRFLDEYVKVGVGNPDALPIVLIILTLYFALRFILEWFQISIEIRHSTIMKADFFITVYIGMIALAAFLFKVSIEEFKILSTRAFFLGLLLPCVLGFIVKLPQRKKSITMFYKRKTKEFKEFLLGEMVPIFFGLAVIILFIIQLTKDDPVKLVSENKNAVPQFFLGLIIGLPFPYLTSLLSKVLKENKVYK
ncbi:MAG: hypothetical protein PVH88_17140 [Ignavibacteria bacterium]|jgi:hypothetical protein